MTTPRLARNPRNLLYQRVALAKQVETMIADYPLSGDMMSEPGVGSGPLRKYS
ncbi:MAG: hypothetical protein Q4A92_11345 [Corynebacterium sp.]|nr:hypothetical protein [Corynebacterium sp.]